MMPIPLGQFSNFFEEIVYDTNKLSDFKPDVIWVHTTWRNIKNFPTITNNKSEIYKVELRIGTFSALELLINAVRFRFMIFNVGFEIEF